jgi:CheY-like chemotaxis protein
MSARGSQNGQNETGTNRPSTILVVDDNPSVRSITSLLLEQKGYLTLQADSGEQAMALVHRAEHIDLVLSDVQMPNMDGFELARELQADNPMLPIRFMSGMLPDYFSSHHDCPPILAKPFTLENLLRVVRSALTPVDDEGSSQRHVA